MTKHLSQDERRAQILHAARECFIARGYERCRVDDVAKQAGISKGGVYFHFKSKQSIFDALIKQEFDQALERLRLISATTSTAAEKLAALGVFHLTRFQSDPDLPRFILVSSGVALRNHTVKRFLLEMHEALLDELTTIIAAGVESGEFREVDPRGTALILKAIVDGMEAALAIGADTNEQPRLVETALDLIINGIEHKKR